MRKTLFTLAILFTNYTYADNELIEKATVLGILKKVLRDCCLLN